MSHTRLLTVSAAAAIALSGCGLVTRTDRTAQAQEQAHEEVMACGTGQGFDFNDPLAIDSVAFTAGEPSALAFDQCWAEVRDDERFADLDIQLPSEQYRQVIDDEFASWACIESAGYERITPIPLSSEAGYPLTPLAGHFDVEAGDDALIAYYEAAATCSGRSLDSFYSIDGELTRDLADGTECVHHRHGDAPDHSHGCHSTDTYPNGMEPTS